MIGAGLVLATSLIVTSLTFSLPAAAAEPISSDQFNELQALIKPKDSESNWTRIPWMTSLWDARQRAREPRRTVHVVERRFEPPTLRLRDRARSDDRL